MSSRDSHAPMTMRQLVTIAAAENLFKLKGVFVNYGILVSKYLRVTIYAACLFLEFEYVNCRLKNQTNICYDIQKRNWRERMGWKYEWRERQLNSLLSTTLKNFLNLSNLLGDCCCWVYKSEIKSYRKSCIGGSCADCILRYYPFFPPVVLSTKKTLRCTPKAEKDETCLKKLREKKQTTTTLPFKLKHFLKKLYHHGGEDMKVAWLLLC